MVHQVASSPLLAAVFFVVAALYSSVGLGGGSSYTALLVLAGVDAALVPPVSLGLNLVVTSVGAAVFMSRGHARVRLILPFVATSIPMAWVGAGLHLPRRVFLAVLAASLLAAAARIYAPGRPRTPEVPPWARTPLALAAGAALGLVAGICGIGGGVYLVPLVIFLGLGTAREAAACGAFFVWVNSLAGLVPRLAHGGFTPAGFLPLAGAVLAGGLAGSMLGSGRLSARWVERILGLVLVVAAGFLVRRLVF